VCYTCTDFGFFLLQPSVEIMSCICSSQCVPQGVTKRVSDSDWRVRKTALEAVVQLYEPGNTAIVDAVVSRLEDSQLVSSPTFLDVSAKGDNDVKTTAIMCLAKLASHREEVRNFVNVTSTKLDV
jgi:hypothetical protein